MEGIPSLQNQGNILSQITDRKADRLKTQAESGEPKTDEELRKLANQFESIFVNQLMKAMRQTIPKSDLVQSFSLDMYEAMFDQEVATQMSEHKGIGLAEVLYSQLSRLNPSDSEGAARSEDSGPPSPLFEKSNGKEND